MQKPDLTTLRLRVAGPLYSLAEALYEFAERVEGEPQPASDEARDEWLARLRDDEGVTLEHSDERLFNTHPEDRCAGEFCTLHNRSDHSMRSFPQHWRSDRGIMERICPHGVGHPDPDDPATKRDGVHGCDGCCRPMETTQ